MRDELGTWADDEDRDDRDVFESDDESEENEYVLDCGLEGCLMPGYHFRHECHTVEMIEAAEAQALAEPQAQSSEPTASEPRSTAALSADFTDLPF